MTKKTRPKESRLSTEAIRVALGADEVIQLSGDTAAGPFAVAAEAMKLRRSRTNPGKGGVVKLPWRKINPKHWWCSDVGSATRLADGWYASASGYQEVILEPRVGPFKTAREAMSVWEKRRRNERRT